MVRGKLIKVGAGGLALLVVVVGAVVVVQRSRSTREERPEMRALAPSPLAVTVTMLGGGGQIAMGGRAPIALEATGPDIDSVTLWEDDRALSTFGAPARAGTGALTHTVSWTAVTPGVHILHASAHGRDGTAHSTPIGVTVLPAPGTPPSLTVTAPAGATPQSVGAAYGVDPGLVTPGAAPDAAGGTESDTSTGVDPTIAVFSIDTVGVLEAFPPPSGDGSDVGGSSTGGGGAAEPSSTPASTVTKGSDASAGSTDDLGDGTVDSSAPGSATPDTTDGSGVEYVGNPPIAPDVPVLKAKVSSCEVRISAPGGTDALTVYETGVGSVGFTEVGNLAAGGELTTPPMTPGAHVFVAGPVGEPTTTSPVSVVLPESCVRALWKGNASITGGILTIPAPDDGLLAVYLSVDDEPARRIPDEPTGLKFLTAPTRHIDVQPYLPMLVGSKLHLDVWSTDPATNHASKIASGDAELPEGMTPADLIGESTGATLGITPLVAKVVDTTITGTWTTRSARADRVIWQVTTQPMDRSNTSLAPPGLVAWGTSTATGVDADGVGPRGGFTIPISSLVRPMAEPIVAKPITFPQLAKPSPVSNLPIEAKPIFTDIQSIDPDLLAAADVSDPEVTGGLASNLPVPSGSTFFIRVIPLAGTTPLGGASDSVRFDGPTLTDPPQVALQLPSTKFDAGRVGNPALAGCVRVTSVPWDGPSKEQFSSAFFPTAGTYCAGDWKAASDCPLLPDFACAAWNAVAGGVQWFVEVLSKVWDVIATAYNTIVDTVVTIVAKLNPFCVAATLAAESAGELGFDDKVTDVAQGAADLCDGISHAVTEAAVSGVMIAFGLPPELPMSEQLEQMASGNLTELAVEYLKQFGVPCDALVIDADTAGAVSAGMKEAGVDVPAGVSDGVDVCRDLAGLALDNVQSQVRGMYQQQIANSTGLPLPTTPVDGFTFDMEPRAVFTPPSISFAAEPKNPNTPVNGICRVSVRTDLADPKSRTSPEPVFGTTQVGLRSMFGKLWMADTALNFNQLAGYKPPAASLPELTMLEARMTSDCIGSGGSFSEFDFVKPAAGRWKPGDDD